jgi:hypothetical protein
MTLAAGEDAARDNLGGCRTGAEDASFGLTEYYVGSCHAARHKMHMQGRACCGVDWCAGCEGWAQRGALGRGSSLAVRDGRVLFPCEQ